MTSLRKFTSTDRAKILVRSEHSTIRVAVAELRYQWDEGGVGRQSPPPLPHTAPASPKIYALVCIHCPFVAKYSFVAFFF